MKRTLLSFGLTAALGTISAYAATETFGPLAVPSTATDWSQTLNFPQFDSSLGTLTQIDFSINGTLTGFAKAENFGNGSISPTLDLKATISLSDSLGTQLAQTTPLVANTASLSSFDGQIDFAGTSGISFNGLNVAYSTNTFTTSAGDLALFVGNGSIPLTLGSAGNSQVLNGGGNIISQFSTASDGHATITYEYTPAAVPEASTWAAVGFLTAMGGIAYYRQQRKNAA